MTACAVPLVVHREYQQSQRERRKEAPSRGAVLVGDAAVKPLLRQDKEITGFSSDSNNFWYIYTLLSDTKFPLLPLHYERFKAFCSTVERRGAAEDTGAGLALDSKPTSHQNWWWKLHLSWQKAEPGQSWRLLEITSPFFYVWERYAGSNVDSPSITSHRCLWALGQTQGGWQMQMLLFYIRKVLHNDKLRLIQLHR